MMKESIGLIGVGNMGTAILEGLFAKKIASPAQVWVYDKIQEKSVEFSRTWKTHLAVSSAELAAKTDAILLAVKPQDLAATLAEMKSGLKASQILISILAGTPIEKIRTLSGGTLDLVRAMPNLGAKAGASLTALAGGSARAKALSETVFAGCGRTICLEEKHFDLITALSGSGPAYFFYLMELMAQEGEARGLTAEQSRLAAVQTALGAALLAASSPEAPGILRERVTSKGGTTEAALTHLMKTLPATFHDAIQAACDRGKELGKQ